MFFFQPARPPASKRPAAGRQPAERSWSAAPSLRSVRFLLRCPRNVTGNRCDCVTGCKLTTPQS